MPLRSPAARVAALLLIAFSALPGRAAEFVDSAERRVQVPDSVRRVMAADQTAAVLVLVLAPDKLVGWSEPLSRSQRAFLPSKPARLPVVGRLSGPNPTAAAGQVARYHPDLIIASGEVTPEAAALADQIEQQTGVPYLVLDGSIQRTPEMLRVIGLLLGVGDRRLALASFASHAIDGLRGRLLIQSPDGRPLVYYGRGADGLETGLFGARAMSVVDQAGVVNVAARLGSGELTRVTRQQVGAWNPAVIVAQRRSFYDALHRDPGWRSLAAVRNKRVYLAPADPFGWIGDPPGVNRVIGLYWLSSLFYPDAYQEDLRTMAREFYQLYYGVNLSDRQLEALLRLAEAPARASGQQIGVPLFGAEPTPMPSPNATPGMGLPNRPPGRGGLPSSPYGAPGLPQ
jgi:iron complex transport system substrate-binding protein